MGTAALKGVPNCVSRWRVSMTTRVEFNVPKNFLKISKKQKRKYVQSLCMLLCDEFKPLDNKQFSYSVQSLSLKS